MAPLPATFSDLEGHVCCLQKNLYISHTSEIQRVLSTTCLYMNEKAHVACNFNYLFKGKWTSQGHSQSCTLQM